MNPLVIIAGPTAVGKSALSILLAKRIDAEIISADSMQVYKGMDIGSAKITKEGNNYRVNVVFIEEMNPKKNGQSAYSRGMLILTMDDILRIARDECDSLFGGKMIIEMKDKDDASLYYHGGSISALIDSNGNIIEMDSKMLIDVCGKNFSLRIGDSKKPLATCKQFGITVGKEYIQKDFKW